MNGATVVFIARGTTTGGLGHVMRSRTLAVEMSARTATHLIAVGELPICRSLLEGQVDYSVAGDDEECARVTRRMNPDVVVFDLLDFDKACFQALAARCLTVCVSPLFTHLDRVDLAFSRAASPEHERLRSRGRPAVRTGCRFATVAPHCRQVAHQDYHRHAHMSPLSVAVSMGGTDAPNNTLRILEAIRCLPTGLLMWVLLGEGYTHSYQQLIDCAHADRRHEIILAKTTDSMWRILSACSVAILAGGITTYEAAYAGIPSIVTLSEARDRFLIDELVRAGACLYAGAPLEDSLLCITAALRQLDDDRQQLIAMHRRGQRLLDDRGPQRIVDEILDFHAASAKSRELKLCRSA